LITSPAPSEGCEAVKHALSVSVIVPTRNRNADLERCLEAVSRLKLQPAEVLVVDSAPQGDGAREVAARWHARYLREDEPGASRARNRGAEVARGDIVAFTDDDAAPDANWLKPIVHEFSDSRVGLVVGKVEVPSPEPELNRLYELCGFIGQGDERLVVDRETFHWFEQISFLPFGIGPNLAIRRSVFQQWRGFDTRLGPGTHVPGHE
jgi:glycosyltransferase involved in cell wall biosynthesis